MTQASVLVGDCRETIDMMLADASVDAIVTDPPYGLEFMGKGWDKGVPGPEFWTEALRVAKPGAHLVAFGGTRTYHRLACAIEDAGWEIRDCLMWLYGSGFPKSMDVSKAIDANRRGDLVRAKLLHFLGRGDARRIIEESGVASAASLRDWTVGGHVPSERNWQLVKAALGVTDAEEAAYEREVVGSDTKARSTAGASALPTMGAGVEYRTWDITAPATDAAREWAGWGTALKPAWEPIILARKPLAGTVAANVLAHGTGALNVDGCRIAAPVGDRTEYGLDGDESAGRNRNTYSPHDAPRTPYVRPAAGRWPANVVLDEDAAALLGEPARFFLTVRRDTEPPTCPHCATPADVVREARDVPSGAGLLALIHDERSRCPACGEEFYTPDQADRRQDQVAASRFFYCAKASRAERNAGLAGLPLRPVGMVSNTSGQHLTRRDGGAPDPARNHHPTVKPLALMQWLCRLVTPPGGLILDPFTGSGSTGCAAVAEGFRFVGCELSEEYAEIARQRIAHAAKGAVAA